MSQTSFNPSELEAVPRAPTLTGKAIAAHAVRGLKLSFGLAVLSLGVWALLRNFMLLFSTKAVIVASTTTLVAPIDGFVEGQALAPGARVEARAPVAKLNNPWVDDGYVNELELRLASCGAENESMSGVIRDLEGIAASLKSGTNMYQTRRISQLRAVLAESEARLEAERAQAAEAAARFERLTRLSSDGVVMDEKRREAERDSLVFGKQADATASGLDAVRTQLDAAGRGVNIDASGMGSDRPYSRQRLDEVVLELARARGQLSLNAQLREKLEQELVRAKARRSSLSDFTFRAPHGSRIWQVFAAPQSYVVRGGRVATLLNCERLWVVAEVSARVFDRLKVGGSARFKSEANGRSYQARIVQLLGGNLLQPAAELDLAAPATAGNEADAPHRVVLSVPELSRDLQTECTVGQSGDVRFD
jgi:multidrug resistance efflux pump